MGREPDEELLRKIEERRGDHEFMARVRRIVEEQRDVLDRLAMAPYASGAKADPNSTIFPMPQMDTGDSRPSRCANESHPRNEAAAVPLPAARVIEWDDPRGDVGWALISPEGKVLSKHMTRLAAEAAREQYVDADD
jgi:hypothetical protein